MDLSTWLTKNQAAAELGCSTKTVERHAERRDLTKRMRPRPGLMAEVVYDPADVAKLKGKLMETRAAELEKVSPAVHQAGEATASTAIATRKDRPQDVGAFLAMLQGSQGVPIHQRLYLSYPDAAALTGLSEKTIKKAVKANIVRTMPFGSGKRVRREDLSKIGS